MGVHGATRAQVIDAFTQSWEPEEIAKIFGHVEEQAVAQRRRDGDPIDAVMAGMPTLLRLLRRPTTPDSPMSNCPYVLDRLKLFGKVGCWHHPVRQDCGCTPVWRCSGNALLSARSTKR